MLKNICLFNRKTPSRLVLFGSKGRGALSRADRSLAVKDVYLSANPQKIIDFETLAAWYAEHNATKDAVTELNSPHNYTDKQRALRFLSL